jgi:hypothetical protein
MALDKTDLELIERVIYKNGDDIAVSIARSFERLEERIDAAEARIYSRLTNTLAAETIARSRQFRWSTNLSTSDNSAGPQRQSHNIGGSDGVEFEFLPGDFQFLRAGGPENNFEVDAIIYQSGRTWAGSGKNFLRITFNQKDYV